MDPAQLLLPGADLAAAIAQAAPGAALLLAPGTYALVGPVTTRGDLTIVGSGQTELVGETDGRVLWHHAGPGTLRLRGLTLRQHVGGTAGWTQDHRADLLVATGGTLEVVACAFPALRAGVEPLDEDQDPFFGWFFKAGGTAIVLRQDVIASIRGCSFGRAPQDPVQDTQGVAVEERAQAAIAGCRFEGLAKGVEVALGAGLDLRDSAFVGCGDGVFASWWETGYDTDAPRPQAPRTIVGCTFERNDLGMIVGGPQRSRVAGCFFVGNRRPLTVRHAGADLVGNRFAGNAEGVADPGQVAVWLDGEAP